MESLGHLRNDAINITFYSPGLGLQTRKVGCERRCHLGVEDVVVILDGLQELGHCLGCILCCGLGLGFPGNPFDNGSPQRGYRDIHQVREM